MKRVYGVLFLVAFSLGVFAVASENAFARCYWTGRWNTNWGTMSLSQSGSSASGSYTYRNGTVSGSVSGNVFSGTWRQGRRSGWFRFTMISDCNAFDGAWGYSPGTTMGGWGGTRAR